MKTNKITDPAVSKKNTLNSFKSQNALPITGSRILAEGFEVSNDTRKTNKNNNDLVVGSSGSGKTGGYIIPNILRTTDSFVCADTKCSLYAKMKKPLEEKGFSVYLVDFVNPERSSVYNPLLYIRGNSASDYCQQDVKTIAAALLPESLCKDDAFWVSSARNLVEMMIAYVYESFEEKDRNFLSVLEVFRAISSMSSSSIAQKGIMFLETWAAAHPDNYSTRLYRMIVGQAGADKTWSCILSFAASGLASFNMNSSDKMFSGAPKFTFSDLGDRKCAVFLNVSDTDRALDKLVNVFYTQALQVLCRAADNSPNNRLNVPVRIYLDDFAANVVIPDFDKIISVIRSREIYVSIIVQSLSQLETMYSRAQSLTIVNNCDHILYLGCNDRETANFLSVRADKAVKTILSMPTDKVYIISRGASAVLCDKIRPYSEKYCAHIFDDLSCDSA